MPFDLDNNETELYNFQDFSCSIKFGDVGIYSTKKYMSIKKTLQKFNIVEQPVKTALDELFLKCSKYILQEIKEIVQFPEKAILVIRIGNYAKELAEMAFQASLSSGWYYYITGINYYEQFEKETRNSIKTIQQNSKLNPLFNEFINPDEIQITTIIDTSQYHCFDLQIRDVHIFLDCGFPVQIKSNFNSEITQDQLTKIQKYIHENSPKWVIITHSHKDHRLGLPYLLNLNENNNTEAIIGTQTTGLLLIQKIFANDFRIQTKIRQIFHTVKYHKSLAIAKNCKLNFYEAGHSPGALSVFVKLQYYSDLKSEEPLTFDANELNSRKKHSKIHYWRFLYSGDFYLSSIPPFSGFENAIKRIPKDQPVDIAILDGARIFNRSPSLIEQISAIYKESEKIWENNGSVVIATDAQAIAPSIFLYFWKQNRQRESPVPIYVDNAILEVFHILSNSLDDLQSKIRSQIKNHKNPFESWQIHPITSIRTTYHALSQPSIILTHPNQIDKPPLRDIFPLMAMDEANMLVFAYFIIKGDEEITWEFIRHDPTTIEYYTTLKGILSKAKLLKFNPKCHIFNRMVPYSRYSFSNHANKEEHQILLKNLPIKEVIYFHQKPLKILKPIKKE